MTTVQSPWRMVSERARATPDRLLMVEADGAAFSYADVDRASLYWSRELLRQGLGPGARVAVLMPNQAALYVARLACGRAGSVFMAIAPVLTGSALVDALTRCAPDAVIVSDDALNGLLEVGSRLPRNLRVLGLSTFWPGDTDAPDDVETPCDVASLPDPGSAAVVVYTSGTSGPGKPVRLDGNSLQLYASTLFDDAHRTWTPDAGYYSPWHPAHILGAVALDVALRRGLTLVLRQKFDIACFWDDVARFDCRLTVLIAVAAEVWERREPARRDNTLELVGMAPLIARFDEFQAYFGVDAVSIYGMTEVGTALTARSPTDSRSTGRPVPGYQCRLADVPDLEPALGRGELLVRPTFQPSRYESGGRLDADLTQRCWDDGWFHTGDLFEEHDGVYTFLGRIKDSIRRRGRNISAADLEDEVRRIPGVLDGVCVGIGFRAGDAFTGTDDEDIRLFVMPVPGVELDPGELSRELIDRLPGYMVPRFLDVVSDFPRSVSGKVSRLSLRQTPLGQETFDRKRLTAR